MDVKKPENSIEKILSIGIIFLIVLTLTLGNFIPAFAVSTKAPDTKGQAAVVIDGKSGNVIYEKEKDLALHPASTTKLLTAILVVENLNLKKEATVGALPSLTGGVTMGLKAEEVIRVEDLLWAMMLESANDAAVVLAEQVSGTVPEFAKLMNSKAKEIGAQNSNFVNPNGMPDSDHRSTAYDLALITKEAMKHEAISEITKAETHEIGPTNKTGTRKLTNINQLISGTTTIETENGKTPIKYKHAVGGKTGTTTEAGECLAAVAKYKETELIAVTLNAGANPARYQDAINLFEYGFKNYRTYQIEEKGEKIAKVKIKKGSDPKIWAVAKEGIYVTLPKEGADDLAKTKVELDQIKAPVKKGDKVGTVKTYAGDQLMGEGVLVAAKTVKEGGPWTLIGISDWAALIIGVTVTTLTVAVLLLRKINRQKNYRRKKAIEAIREKRQAEDKTKETKKHERDTRRGWPF